MAEQAETAAARLGKLAVPSALVVEYPSVKMVLSRSFMDLSATAGDD
jgi:hypothetical protein